jgi:hippurate hydrolase
MDALPIHETTELPWASTVREKCTPAADGHTTILLAAAKYIASPACQFNGTVHLIFQPAEEAIGGADLMIKTACLSASPANASLAAQHARLPVGKLGFYAGNFMASADTVKITITGYGGHGATRARSTHRRRLGAGDGPAKHRGA